MANKLPTGAIIACENSDIEALRRLIGTKQDLSSTDREGKTLLHHCAETETGDNRDESCAALLLRENTSGGRLERLQVDARDQSGFTALHLAAISGNAGIIDLLCEHGASVDLPDNDQHTGLHWAVVCGRVECVDQLLRRGAALSIPDSNGVHPLHYAVQCFLNDANVGGQLLTKLLQAGATVDCVDTDARTPLLWAAGFGLGDCCQLLLAHGARTDCRDASGLSPLHCAASKGQLKVIQLLLQSSEAGGVDVDCVDDNGCTALFYAVSLGHLDTVKYLLEHRSNPDHQDHRGYSAAHCAGLTGDVRALRLLKQHGGSLWLKNNEGDTPLNESCEAGSADTVQFLLDATDKSELEKHLSERNSVGLTSLHLAAMTGSSRICALLADYGADVNAASEETEYGEGRTALDFSSNPDCRRVLRQHGAKSLSQSTAVSDDDTYAGTDAGGAGSRRNSLLKSYKFTINVKPDSGKIRRPSTKCQRRSNDEDSTSLHSYQSNVSQFAPESNEAESGYVHTSSSSESLHSAGIKATVATLSLDSHSLENENDSFNNGSENTQLPEVKTASDGQQLKTAKLAQQNRKKRKKVPIAKIIAESVHRFEGIRLISQSLAKQKQRDLRLYYPCTNLTQDSKIKKTIGKNADPNNGISKQSESTRSSQTGIHIDRSCWGEQRGRRREAPTTQLLSHLEQSHQRKASPKGRSSNRSVAKKSKSKSPRKENETETDIKMRHRVRKAYAPWNPPAELLKGMPCYLNTLDTKR